MTGLMRAEWLKATRTGTSRVLLALLLGIGAMIVVAASLTVVSSASQVTRQAMYAVIGFPNGVIMALEAISALLMFIVPVFIANLIGSEYSGDTWKNMLVRRPGRGRFLAAKLVVGFVLLLLGFLATTLVTQGLASVAHAVVAGPATQAGLAASALPGDQFLQRLGLECVPLLLNMLVLTALATLFTVISRSTVGGVLVALVFPIAVDTAARFLPSLTPYTIGPNVQSVTKNLVGNGDGAFATWQSLLVLAVYIVVPLVAAAVTFHKRDMAG
jgi:ABC-2 type transport system permease protein